MIETPNSLRISTQVTESSVCKSLERVSHKRNKTFGINPVVCQKKVTQKTYFKRLSQPKGAMTPSHRFSYKFA